MRIGLCGAHRTGKTTLAVALAARLNLRTVLSGTSAIVASYGFNMGSDNRLMHPGGLAMQQQIVDALFDGQCGDNFVADRTPIDAAAYLLADAVAPAGGTQTQEDVLTYVEQATRDTLKRFDLLVLVPPAIRFEAAEGKPPFNAAYQYHHHTLCRGLMLDREDSLVHAVELPFEVTDLNERVDFVHAHVAEALSNRRLRKAINRLEIF